MPNRKLMKELKGLFAGEMAAAVTFIVALISITYNLDLRLDMIVIYPFFILIFVLLQGSYYWFYCLKRLRGDKVNQQRVRSYYKALRVIDFILMFQYPFVLIYCFLNGKHFLVSGKVIAGLCIYIFSIVEYINYFYVRLSYSKFKDIILLLMLKNLKKSSLYKELQK